MGTTPNAAVITRLGYNADDLQKGLAQAKQDVAKYKEDALRLDAELRREKIKNSTEYSRERRKQIQDELSQLRTSLAQQSGAMSHLRGAQKQAAVEQFKELRAEFDQRKAILKQFDDQHKKVVDLQKAQVEAAIAVKRSQMAAGLFTQAGPTLSDQIAAAIRQQALQSALLSSGPLGGAISAGRGAAGGLGGGAALAVGGTVAVIAAAAAVAVALKDAAMAGGEYAHSLELISQKSGIAKQDLQKFEAVGKAFGVDLGDMVLATKALSAAIVGGGADEGIESAGSKGAKVLAAFGIATHDGTGNARKFTDVLLDMADLFKQLPDGPEKVRIAVDLLGRSGQNLIPLLNKGRAGFSEFLSQFEDVIPNLDAAAAAFEKLEIEQIKFDLQMQGLKARIGEEVLPAITSFIAHLNDLIRTWKEAGALSGLRAGIFGGGLPNVSRLAQNIGIRTPVSFASEEDAQLLVEINRAIQQAKKSGGAFTLAGIGLSDEARRIVEASKRFEGNDLQKAFNQLVFEGKIQIEESRDAEGEINRELEAKLKKYREIKDIEKEAAEAKRLSAQLNEAEARDLDLIADRQKAVADAARKTAQTESETLNLTQQRLGVVDAELTASVERERKAREAAAGEKLSVKERLEAQKKINDEVEKSTKLIREQGELSKTLADTFQKIASEALAGKPTRQAPPLMMQAPQPRGFRDFTSELADLRVQEALGINVVNQELEIRRALNTALIEQIRLRMASGVATNKERQELEKLLGELKQNREEISRGSSAAFKQSTFGQFLEGMQKVSDIVGKFAPSLNKGLGQLFALFEVFKALGDQLRLLGGGTMQGGQVVGGSAFAGLQGLFTGRGSGVQIGTDVFGAPKVSGTTLTSGQRMQAAMMLIAGITGGISQWRQGGTLNRTIGGATTGGTIGMAAGGPIGAAIGAIIGAAIGAISSTQNKGIGALAGFALGGPIGAIFGFRAASRRAETKRIADEIKAALKTITDAYASGSGTLKATIDGLEKERASAIARLTGKKGAGKQLKEITDAIDKELLTLKRQQKDILDAFNLKVALAGVPENARETAQSISELAKVLKEAADAGAGADQQIKYLNATLDDLKVKLGRDLRSDEQETIDLLMQEIDLQKQREGIIKDAADAELAVKQKLGLARVLTPAQQAAQEIKAIRDQRDEKLKLLDEEAARLKAQVEGRAELFGFSSAELDLQGERTSLLERQLELERSITAEIIARIQEQKALFASLAAGTIPNLPAGILPPGYTFPAGTSYSINNPTLVFNFTTPPANSQEAARIVRTGFAEIAERKKAGYEA